jgi:parvulin-like peptidyl-prolyl isomerase
MKKIIFSLFFTLLLLSSAYAEIVDRVVAIVGNDIITLSDVKKYNTQRSANPRVLLETPNSSEKKDPSESEVNAAIQDMLARNKATMDQLKNELSRKGVSFEQYKKDFASQISQMKFLSQVIFPRIKVSEEDILRKAGASSNEARTRARIEILQARSSEELARYLDEARARTYVEIKK